MDSIVAQLVSVSAFLHSLDPQETNGPQACNVSLGEPGADVGPRSAGGQFIAKIGCTEDRLESVQISFGILRIGGQP